MKNTFIIIGFIFFSLILNAQEHAVNLSTVQEENAFVVNATNNSNIRQEVTITLTVKNLKGYSGPITKLVNAKETIEVVRLRFIPNKQAQLASNYTYKPKPTEAEIDLQDKKLKEKTVTGVDDMNNGIVLFYKDGCPRCAYVTTYMLDNNIDFKLLDTSSDKESNRLMWKLLKEENSNLKNIKMPVVLVNGKVNYNMKDLKDFAQGLPRN